jgi:hypothetical protein
LAFAVLWGYSSRANDAHGAALPTTTDTQALVIVAATTAFLSSLSADQRGKVQFTFTSQKTVTAAEFRGGMNGRMDFVGEQYGQSVWMNFPVSDVPRFGLRLGSLSATQRALAMPMLRVVLSAEGLPKGYRHYGL